MECQKITKLLDTTSNNVPIFIIKKWIDVHDQPSNAESRYKLSKHIRFKTSVLQLDSCNYSDTYIIVKGTIIVTDPNNDAYDKKLAFKNNATFISRITEINNTFIENAGDLYVVIPIYSLI